MTAQNVGSIALNIFNYIQPMPSNISGLLYTVVEGKLNYVSSYLGESIDVNNIAVQYQQPIEFLSLSQVAGIMALQDMGVQTVDVDGLSANNANLKDMSKQFELNGMTALTALIKSLKMYKTRG